jgi:hypothetical protein
VSGAALHILALVSGYPDAERRSRFLAMLQGFGDDTGKGNEPVFALGGFVASVEQWMDFADAWDAKIKEEPSIGYFKASDAAACRREFLRFDPAQRDKKVTDLISLINAYAQFFVGCAIVREDWGKVFRGQMAKTMDSPFFFAYMRLMTSSLQRLFSFGPAIDKVEWIFDEEVQTIYREVLNWWLAQKAEPPLYLSRRMGNHPIMGNDKEVMPLQAADLIVACGPEPPVLAGDGHSWQNLLSRVKGWQPERGPGTPPGRVGRAATGGSYSRYGWKAAVRRPGDTVAVVTGA